MKKQIWVYTCLLILLFRSCFFYFWLIRVQNDIPVALVNVVIFNSYQNVQIFIYEQRRDLCQGQGYGGDIFVGAWDRFINLKKHSVIELVHLSPFFVLFTTIMRQLHIVQTVYISSTPINDRLCPIKVLLCSLSATFLYPINHDQLYFLEPHL